MLTAPFKKPHAVPLNLVFSPSRDFQWLNCWGVRSWRQSNQFYNEPPLFVNQICRSDRVDVRSNCYSGCQVTVLNSFSLFFSPPPPPAARVWSERRRCCCCVCNTKRQRSGSLQRETLYRIKAVAAILNVMGGDAQTDRKTVASEKNKQNKTPACYVSSPVPLPQLLFHLIPTQFCLYSGGNLVFWLLQNMLMTRLFTLCSAFILALHFSHLFFRGRAFFSSQKCPVTLATVRYTASSLITPFTAFHSVSKHGSRFYSAHTRTKATSGLTVRPNQPQRSMQDRITMTEDLFPVWGCGFSSNSKCHADSRVHGQSGSWSQRRQRNAFSVSHLFY